MGGSRTRWKGKKVMNLKTMQMYEYIVTESKAYTTTNGEIGGSVQTVLLSISSPHASLTIPSSFW